MSATLSGCRFSERDRAALLSLPQIGPIVISRLECAGFHSLEAMRRAGLEVVVDAVCEQVGDKAWRNRCRALQRALG